MLLKEVIEIIDLLDGPEGGRKEIKEYFLSRGVRPEEIRLETITGEKGKTTFVKIYLSGQKGKRSGGEAPTLGVIGRLGGIGARPHRLGLVSDADGAITALAVAAYLAKMRSRGDFLAGDVIIATHLCPEAPIIPHEPVLFMGSPVSMEIMNQYEVDPAMEAILSIDTTRGNKIINHRGFAISPTVKEGYILRVSEALLSIMEIVTGRAPVVFALTTQDITPYGNGLYHLNSIMQPATATSAPVVGVAITSEVPVPGCSTGATQFCDIEMAARFVVEVAKAFGEGQCPFYDRAEFERLVKLYGPMTHLQTPGRSMNWQPEQKIRVDLP